MHKGRQSDRAELQGKTKKNPRQGSGWRHSKGGRRGSIRGGDVPTGAVKSRLRWGRVL